MVEQCPNNIYFLYDKWIFFIFRGYKIFHISLQNKLFRNLLALSENKFDRPFYFYPWNNTQPCKLLQPTWDNILFCIEDFIHICKLLLCLDKCIRPNPIYNHNIYAHKFIDIANIKSKIETYLWKIYGREEICLFL